MDAEQSPPDHIPNHVIEAILDHIPFDGWSSASLDMAAADCGLSEVEMRSIFPAGIVDAIAAYGAYADRNMITAFHGQDEADIAVMPVHMKIRSLILIRLEQAAPYKEVVRRTLAVLARPQHAKLASQLLYETVDEMWRAAGDTSTDYNSTPNGRLYQLFTVLRCWLFYPIILLIWQRQKRFSTGDWRMWQSCQRWYDLLEPWQIWPCVLPVLSCVAAAHAELKLCFILTPSPLISKSCSGL